SCTGRVHFRLSGRFAHRLPLLDELAAGLACRQAKQQAAREPDRVRSKAAKRRRSRGTGKMATAVEPQSERRGQFMKEITAQVSHGIAQRFGAAMAELEQIGAGEGGALIY